MEKVGQCPSVGLGGSKGLPTAPFPCPVPCPALCALRGGHPHKGFGEQGLGVQGLPCSCVWAEGPGTTSP